MVEALTKKGKCISVSDVITQIDNLPGDAIHANIESIKEHFEDTAWAQVLAKGILSFKENAHITSPELKSKYNTIQYFLKEIKKR